MTDSRGFRINTASYMRLSLMAYPAEACPGFQSIKRLWVLLLSLDGMPVRHKAPALHFISLPWPFVGQGTLYTRGWWDAVRLKCVAREQNTKPDRASNPQPYGLTLGLNGSPKKLTCIDSIHYLLSVEFAAPDPSQQRCFLVLQVNYLWWEILFTTFLIFAQFTCAYCSNVSAFFFAIR